MEREKIIAQARAWLNKNESDRSFKEILDTYNQIKPLPRGYRVQVSDAWCAAYVSAVFFKCGANDFPFECSCGKMIEKAQQQGIWVENDAYVPEIADVILYNWGDSGKGDNKGWPNHVGIVEKVENNVITVIEGNIGNEVGRREIEINGRYIRGFICYKYEENVVTEEYYPRYDGSTRSIVDALKSLKIDSSYKHRKEIAIKNGFVNYTGKAEENSAMLKLLKNGMLVKE
jgi:hypothetical protein